jgi:mono/diheme cytochrome c family protein
MDPSKDFSRAHLPQVDPPAEARALINLYLEARIGALDPPKERREPSVAARTLAEGERIMAKFNCQGCHVVDELKLWLHDDGKVVRAHAWFKSVVPRETGPQWAVEWLRDPATLEPDPLSKKYSHMFPETAVDRWEPARGGLFQARRLEFATAQEAEDLAYRFPPPLRTAGRKLDPDWLRGFLASPRSMRPTRSRMPTFNFAPGEIDSLVAYFRARDGSRPEDARGRLTPEEIEKRYDRLAYADRVLRFDCIKCHPLDGAGGNLGPELADAHARLQRPWLRAYHLNPASIYPRTAMPDLPKDADLDDMTDLLLNYEQVRLAKAKRGGLREVREALATKGSDAGEVARVALGRAAREAGLEGAVDQALSVALKAGGRFGQELSALTKHKEVRVRAASVMAIVRLREAGAIEAALASVKDPAVARAVREGLIGLAPGEMTQRRIEAGKGTPKEWMEKLGGRADGIEGEALGFAGGTVAALLLELSTRTGGAAILRDGRLVLLPLAAALRELIVPRE